MTDDASAESTLNLQPRRRGRPFAKGQSGNPAGKPPGTRNRATVLTELLLEGESNQLVRKAIELALAGDVGALRLCLERVVPPRRERTVKFTVPKIKHAESAAAAQAAVVTAVGAGELTPGEAVQVSQIIDGMVRAFEAADLEDRVKALEESRNARP